MTDNGNTYQTHDEIANYLANHHGAGAFIEETTTPEEHRIPLITHGEVLESLAKAPTHSTIGTDNIGIPLLKAYNAVHPIENILMSILRKGTHLSEWKQVIVVPIPKANKPSYNKAKSWRSIHLLSLLSKTLEHIVLERLQDKDMKPKHNLGPTQFGSRKGTGTSDVFRLLKDWIAQADKENLKTSLVLSDVEGGFDKVNPEKLETMQTIDPLYKNWIRN